MGDKFIADLSYDEKIIFLKVFCKLVKSDGNVSGGEVGFLKAVARRYGIKNQDIVNIFRDVASMNCVTEVQKITNRKHALQLIKELCVLANVDEDLHDAELDIVIDVAQALDIEEEKVVQINRWVLNNFVLAKVGRIILETDDE